MNVVHFLLKRTGIKKINPYAVAGLIILCLPVAPVLAFAGAMYICTDQDGNQIVTNAPREGMSNCVLKYPAEDSSPRANITSPEGPSRSANITSHGDPSRKVNIPSHEDPSPEGKIASMRKKAAMSICNHIPRMMNNVRDHLNRAAQRKWSELEKGRMDIRPATSMLDSAEQMSRDCQCPPLTMEIARAAEFAQKAYYESSVDKFSDLLTKAIQAFNQAGEAFKYCK